MQTRITRERGSMRVRRGLNLGQLGNLQDLSASTCSCRQFHQHFTYEFFVRMLFWQLFSSYMYIEKAAKTTFIQKICT